MSPDITIRQQIGALAPEVTMGRTHNSSYFARTAPLVAFTILFAHNPKVRAQDSADTTQSLQHDRVFSYLLADGSCLFGELESADKSNLTIRQYNKPSIKIPKTDLVQMGQGHELFYSARSSWSDVETEKIYAREALILKLKNGKLVRGKPKTIASDTIELQQALTTKVFQKDQIQTVLAWKIKPPTASFEFVLEEEGFFTIFYPEFYKRIFGLEGHVPVRLYESSLTQDDSDGITRCFPSRSPVTSTPKKAEAK